jgi:hypothetical protein
VIGRSVDLQVDITSKPHRTTAPQHGNARTAKYAMRASAAGEPA